MKYTKLSFLTILLGTLILTGCHLKNAPAKTSVQILEQHYTGTLEFTDASGTGTFKADVPDSIVVSGTWKNSMLQGAATVNYPDGSTLTGKFKNGLLSGTATKTNKDGSYFTFKCNSSNPNGLITYYSKEGQLLSYDWFYQKTPIQDLLAHSSEANYRELLCNPNDNLVFPYKISGIVQAIYDSNTSTYMHLTDKQGNFYICTYQNYTPARYTQALVPNFAIGDHVSVYGYLQKCDSLSSFENLYLSEFILNTSYSSENIGFNIIDTSDSTSTTTGDSEKLNEDSFLNKSSTSTESLPNNYSSTIGSNAESVCPVITLFYGELEEASPFERPTTSKFLSYEDICRYPYHCATLPITIKGTIINQTINYKNSSMELIIEQEDTKNIYFSTYHFADQTVFPTKGDFITINGTLKGNNKLTASQKNKISYVICPRIMSKDITIH